MNFLQRGVRRFLSSKRANKMRRFSAARPGRLNNYYVPSIRINQDLKQDYIGLVNMARDMAKNDDYVGGYLKGLERNVIGAPGFRLRCKAQTGSGENVESVAKQIEKLWRKYQKKSTQAITADRKTGGRDFDILILRTLITDGEVFIRIHRDGGRYGVRYSIIDSLDVDCMYNAELGDGERIVMGVRIDADSRPISYFVRDSNNDFYNCGQRVEIPARDVIHIFRNYSAGQVRGYTVLAAAMLNLNHLSSYREAELIAARMQACQMLIYEKTGVDDGFGAQGDDDGEFLERMEPGQITVAPNGYAAKQIQNQHPSSNFGLFVKNILRGISNSLGISYNKATQDYESVNFSSLREAALEDREGFLELQNFIIESWKEVQFQNFLNGILYSENIRAADVEKISYSFIGRRFEWVDPVKDMTVIKMKLDMKLSDPITEIEKLGEDPDDVLDRWVQWNEMLKRRGISAAPEADATQLIETLANQQEEEDNA